ncbi:MAG: hypothetical protein AB1801_24925, partial [Chloroflexota bacterium]
SYAAAGQWGMATVSAASTAAPWVPGSVIRHIPGVGRIAPKVDELFASKRAGYHATDPDVVPLIEKNGFRNGQAPGRLGANGVYVNNTPEGAIAEFAHHNPGKTPAVLKVEYSPGVEAVTDVAPIKYVEDIPLNVDSVSAPSVRNPTTTNTNVFNNSVRIIERVR